MIHRRASEDGPRVTIEDEKRAAAEEAVLLVEKGMVVGLGSGTTAAYAIRALARRMEKGLRASGVPTSKATQALAEELDIPLILLDALPPIDITIDGADEVDPKLQLIKGGGGALLREKVVAANSERLVIVVDSTKTVDVLGSFHVPVEISPFARSVVEMAIEEIGGKAHLRMVDGQPFSTDQENWILDCDLGPIPDPEARASQLADIPGVIEHGLFVDMADEIFIGRGEVVEVLRSRSGD